MKNIFFYNSYEELNKDNFLFSEIEASIGDELLLAFYEMGLNSVKKGLKIQTAEDLDKIKKGDPIVIIDLPVKGTHFFHKLMEIEGPKYLIMLESPNIRPDNFKDENIKIFEKIFTWSDDLIKLNPHKYIKINYSCRWPEYIEPDAVQRSNKIIVIASNKVSSFRNELYSERLNFIREYQKKNDIELYGKGWNSRTYGNKYLNFLQKKIPTISNLTWNPPACYKGEAKSKRELLQKNRISLCFENVYGYSGYITEKILDSLRYGCVPIYKGASNIKNYIPYNCFIDASNYSNMKELSSDITKLHIDQILEHQRAINDFLKSDYINMFKTHTFSETILNELSK